MDGGEKLSLEQMRAFLESSQEVGFQGRGRKEIYTFVNQVLRQQDYGKLGKASKGLVKCYLAKISGMSRAQMTRLIGSYQHGKEVQPRPYQRRKFVSKYTPADIELLARTDEAHETLSGPATQKILYRELHDFGNIKYNRLSQISVAHLYRLRKTRIYRNRLATYQATRPAKITIGERRQPNPQGRPGYLRVDTVHQGDLEGIKGLYHINAVDEVTQWQVVGATPYISEAWLLPLLQSMLEQFPFHVRGFHSDNGSEFINYTVANLLNKLLIEQTKSRPRHSNDNGLVETKNGAVIRKHIGFGHISSVHAEDFDRFYRQHFNPYLNFHRPCGVPETRTADNGKTKRVYRWYATPWEILRQLPEVTRSLRGDLTIDHLAQMATKMSDTEAAMLMREAKRKLFASLVKRSA